MQRQIGMYWMALRAISPGLSGSLGHLFVFEFLPGFY